MRGKILLKNNLSLFLFFIVQSSQSVNTNTEPCSLVFGLHLHLSPRPSSITVGWDCLRLKWGQDSSD